MPRPFFTPFGQPFSTFLRTISASVNWIQIFPPNSMKLPWNIKFSRDITTSHPNETVYAFHEHNPLLPRGYTFSKCRSHERCYFHPSFPASLTLFLLTPQINPPHSVGRWCNANLVTGAFPVDQSGVRPSRIMYSAKRARGSMWCFAWEMLLQSRSPASTLEILLPSQTIFVSLCTLHRFIWFLLRNICVSEPDCNVAK